MSNQITEVSKKLINNYIQKTTNQDGSGGRKLGKGYNLALAKKWGGSRKGVTAKVRATEEVSLDEISSEKLQDYQYAASADYRKAKKNARRQGARAPLEKVGLHVDKSVLKD